MTKLRGVGVGVVFLVGCAVGDAAGRFVVPAASAQQAAGTRWEYFCFDEWKAKDVMPLANNAGAQGWEMVAAGGPAGAISWCFKRSHL